MGLNEALLKAVVPSADDRRDIMQGMKATFDLVCSMSKTLIVTFGRVSTPLVVPHDVAKVPMIETQPVTGTVIFDIKGRLNKAATKGHIKNLGENPVYIRFEQVGNGGWTNLYELAPGDVLDFGSWASDTIELRKTTAGDTRVCLLAQ